MSRGDVILWILVILFAIFIIWLVLTGRAQALANLFVEGYWKFLQNIVKPLHR